jgi:type VI secretion system secreted protein VgrG
MPKFTQEERSIKLTTPLGANALIPVKISGREAVSELFHFRIEAIWQNATPLDFTQLLGKDVTVRIEMDDPREPRLINGIVSAIQQGAQDRDESYVTTYLIDIVPSTWIATLNTQIRIFQQKSVPDIIQAVLTGLGLSSTLKLKTTGTYSPRDYCVQYYESDFAFISRLMEHEGIFYYYEHAEDSHSLVVGDAPTVFQDIPDPIEVQFEEASGGGHAPWTVFDWVKAGEIRSGKYTITDWNFETPHASLMATRQSENNVGGGQKLEVYENPGSYMTHDVGEALAKVRLQEEATPGLVYHGVGEHPLLSPGYKFKLASHFADDGEYSVISAEHEASQAIDLKAGSAQPFQYQSRFTAIAADVQYRPQRVTPIPRVRGVQTAIVVGASGEEIYCDKYGRIKVQFHWDREGAYDDKSSCWVRVATHWAGAQWGAIHLPRVGQEVIVDFIEGDVDRPIVVGSVYNSEMMPPYTLPANKTMSGIRSRSSKNGANDALNEIRFEDKVGSEDFFMQAQKDMDVRVKNDRKEWVKQDASLTVDQDNYRLIKRDENVAVTRDLLEKIDRDHHVKVGGKSAEAVTGSYSLKVTGDVAEEFSQNHSEQAGMNLYLKGGMNVVVEAGIALTLKVGGSFVNIGPSGVFISGPMVYINSGGAAGSGQACTLVAAAAAGTATMPITTQPTSVGQSYTASPLTSSPGTVSSSSSAPTSGNAGAGGGGAGGSAPPPGPTHDPKAEENQDKQHYVAIKLVDETGAPLAGEAFEIKLPDGSYYTGTTDEKGEGRTDHIDPGNVEISFPNLDKEAWEPS